MHEEGAPGFRYAGQPGGLPLVGPQPGVRQTGGGPGGQGGGPGGGPGRRRRVHVHRRRGRSCPCALRTWVRCSGC
ncbi:hypothetical protein DRB96_26245 [Streptomyces sp. ICC1]|nr:hypothetical protein DRB89_18720 [Streptomyces sp. ICC4]AWZ15174.1 hypothetical protein DRB96_26245 [Streptomyces sp. ICC1]